MNGLIKKFNTKTSKDSVYGDVHKEQTKTEIVYGKDDLVSSCSLHNYTSVVYPIRYTHCVTSSIVAVCILAPSCTGEKLVWLTDY